jgi:hypothetical protein
MTREKNVDFIIDHQVSSSLYKKVNSSHGCSDRVAEIFPTQDTYVVPIPQENRAKIKEKYCSQLRNNYHVYQVVQKIGNSREKPPSD